MDEMVIDLGDLFHQILKRWRAIIVWMLVGALACNGYGYYKAVREAQALSQAVEEKEVDAAVYSDAVESARNALIAGQKTSSQIMALDLMFDSYVATEKNLEFQQTYMENSIYLSLDPECVPTLELAYRIDTHYTVEYPVIAKTDWTSSIASLYAARVRSDEICGVLAEELSVPATADYVRELVSTSVNASGDVLTIILVAPTKADCQAMAEKMDAFVAGQKAEIGKAYGSFDVTKISETYKEVVNRDIMTTRQSYADNVRSLANSMASLAKDQEEDAAAYLNALVAQYEYEKKAEEEEKALDHTDGQQQSAGGKDAVEPEKVGEPEAVVPYVSPVRTKYLALGLVLGAFLVCAFVGMSYLLSKRLRTKGDMTDVFQVMFLGRVSFKEKDKKKRLFGFVDDAIEKMFTDPYSGFTEAEQLEMVCAGIDIAADKGDMKKILITCSCKDQVAEDLKKKIMSSASTAGGRMVKTTGSVVCDPRSMEDLAGCDGVVLVERIGVSRYQDIARELELCRKYGVQVIGSVMV